MFRLAENPRLRALHTVPNALPTNIYFDGSPAFIGLAFGQVSDYRDFIQGHHRLQVFLVEAGGQEVEVLDAEIEDLGINRDYTLVLTGLLPDIHTLLLVDSTSAPGHNRAKVRLLHTSPDAPALDMVVLRGPTLFKGVSFREITPFQEISARTVDLEVRPSGSPQSIMSVPDYTFSAGHLYTFVALGLLNGTPGFMVMPLVEAVEMLSPA